MTWHSRWGCWALYKYKRMGVDDMTQWVGVLGAKQIPKGGVGERGLLFSGLSA